MSGTCKLPSPALTALDWSIADGEIDMLWGECHSQYSYVKTTKIDE